MSTILRITEGWTGQLGPFTLRVDGLPIDLSGKTVTIHLRNALGNAVAASGTLTVDPDQVTNKGKLTYTPAETDFVWVAGVYSNTQEYRIHFKVVSGASKTFHPNGEPDVIEVHRV